MQETNLQSHCGDRPVATRHRSSARWQKLQIIAIIVVSGVFWQLSAMMLAIHVLLTTGVGR